MDIEVLIVEDNIEYRKAADKFFSENKINQNICIDYDEAMIALTKREYHGCILDCFFPRRTGSGDRTLGEGLVRDLLSLDKTGQRIEAYEKFLEPYLDLKDPELRRIVRYIGSVADKEPKEPIEYPIALVIKNVGEVSKELIGSILKKDSWLFKGLENFKDYYSSLREAIEADERNQPLGILLGEYLASAGFPFVLATSTYHHDELTQPISNYCSRKGWTLVDSSPNSPNEKATSQFWQRAYEALLKEIMDVKN